MVWIFLIKKMEERRRIQLKTKKLQIIDLQLFVKFDKFSSSP